MTPDLPTYIQTHSSMHTHSHLHMHARDGRILDFRKLAFFVVERWARDLELAS